MGTSRLRSLDLLLREYYLEWSEFGFVLSPLPSGIPSSARPVRPLMRIAFRAFEAGFEADEYALVCGLAGVDADGAEHYLNFQRSPEGAADC